tara:strand:- start:2438 stop:3067 length:630 start_codon:yes stop_codon:yes gene_type:complete
MEKTPNITHHNNRRLPDKNTSKQPTPNGSEPKLDADKIDHCKKLGNTLYKVQKEMPSFSIELMYEVLEDDKLNLTDKKLLTIPLALFELSTLTELNINGNVISTLPEELGNLTKLTKLNASNNRLTHLPESIKNLTDLKELLININQLTECNTLGKIKSLTTLNIQSNNLTSLHIDDLQNLKTLYIDYIHLTILKESLKKVPITTVIYK